jgi:glycosyltransferase involved in cell wall biosynthesis
MSLCDFVTAPNDWVTRSLLEAGIPRERVLETAYGWSPTRLASAAQIERPTRPPVFAFVGRGIVRKGLNLLLEAWEKAGVDGTLLIAGRIEDLIQHACSKQLARPDVKRFDYTNDVAAVYAAADVFVFPSHEEGGPLVASEAAGCGLASIVSSMGAGRVIRDGAEGFVLDPYDTEAWVQAIRTLAHDKTLRARMGASAAKRAQEFTWQRLGIRFYEDLVAAIGGAPRGGFDSKLELS